MCVCVCVTFMCKHRLQTSHETAKDRIEGTQGAAEGRRRKLVEMQGKFLQALGNPHYWWSPGGPTVESSHRVRVQLGLMAESSCPDRIETMKSIQAKDRTGSR